MQLAGNLVKASEAWREAEVVALVAAGQRSRGACQSSAAAKDPSARVEGCMGYKHTETKSGVMPAKTGFKPQKKCVAEGRNQPKRKQTTTTNTKHKTQKQTKQPFAKKKKQINSLT